MVKRRGWRRARTFAVGAVAAGASGCLGGGDADVLDLSPSGEGYQIEVLPISFTASFARGEDVYLGDPTGAIYRLEDTDPNEMRRIGTPMIGGHARLLFASARGTLFVSADGSPLYRSTDGGESWSASLDVSVWRMDEDDAGDLYAGNYTSDGVHHATLFRSSDEGGSWSRVFEDTANDHIHTVRWDDLTGRLYISFGDGPTRGQAVSEDRGRTFRILASGRHEGHTDLALDEGYLFWGSDDGSGRVYRVDRGTGETRTLLGGSQYMWFAVGAGDEIYVGTAPSNPRGGERAALLASADQGETWQKLLEGRPSRRPYDRLFGGDSRVLSAGGWLYCSADGIGYRVRREATDRTSEGRASPERSELPPGKEEGEGEKSQGGGEAGR
jgi:hypothetical protein